MINIGGSGGNNAYRTTIFDNIGFPGLGINEIYTVGTSAIDICIAFDDNFFQCNIAITDCFVNGKITFDDSILQDNILGFYSYIAINGY